MSWREVLSVESDASLKECKRAYAKLIKTVRPDDQPEEFMAIRKAYESAQAYFSRNKEQPVFNPSKVKEEVYSTFEYREKPTIEKPINIEETTIEEETVVNELDCEESPHLIEVELNIDNSDNTKQLGLDEIHLESADVDNNIYETIEYSSNDYSKEDAETINEVFVNDATESIHDNCYKKLVDHYLNLNNRFDIGKWKSLIDNLNLNEEEALEYILPDFLNNYHDLSADIWSYLEQNYKIFSMKRFKYRHRIEYPTNFDHSLQASCVEDKNMYITLRNQMYYSMIGLEEYDEDQIIDQLSGLKYMLFMDPFFYELLLKRLVERKDDVFIQSLEPNKTYHEGLFSLQQRFKGYYLLNSKAHTEAVSVFEASNELSDEIFGHIGLFRSLLALGKIKSAKKSLYNFSTISEKHFFARHIKYKAKHIKSLQNKPISSRLFAESVGDSLAVILIVTIVLLIMVFLVGGFVKLFWPVRIYGLYVLISYVGLKIYKKIMKGRKA